MTDNDTRRWTQQERLASLTHRLANAGRSAQDRPNNDAPIPTQTRAALRAIETRRIARIEPQDLSDAALGRYAAQWHGTTRGDAAAAEITRRADVIDARETDTLDALAYPAGYTRCECQACQDLAARDRAARAPVRVRETIRHGNYNYTATSRGVTARAALAGLLDKSPYYRAYDPTGKTAAVFDRTAAILTETGHAEFGWADYDVIA